MRKIRKENELNDLEQKELMLRELNKYIEEVKELASESPKLSEYHNKLINMVEDIFYANLIINFIDTLAVEENRKEANITKIDVVNIESEFEELFNVCKRKIVTRDNIVPRTDSKVYQAFKEKLNMISKNAYNLLLEIEGYIKLPACEDSITRFKKEVGTLGVKIEDLYGISI